MHGTTKEQKSASWAVRDAEGDEGFEDGSVESETKESCLGAGAMAAKVVVVVVVVERVERNGGSKDKRGMMVGMVVLL